MINCIELFSGAGGLAKGLELAGANHLAFVEWNADACNTLRVNYPKSIVYEGDVRNFNFADYKDVDMIAGGPPCQPFSLGGLAKGNNDKRDMFPAAISAIRQLMPKAFMFENVKGLLRNSFSEYFKYIILQLTYPEIKITSDDWRVNYDRLQDLKDYKGVKYKIKYKLINAADYGVPQKRERVIIVGFRSDLNIGWDFPAPTHSEDSLLWQKYVTGEYWQRHALSRENIDVNEETAKRIRVALTNKYGFLSPELKPWRTIRDALADITKDDDVFTRSEAREYAGHTGSPIDEPSKTIKAGAHGVPGGENMIKFNNGKVRYITVAEAKRIQTFPDNYKITGSWTEAMRQLGNAVPVMLSQKMSQSIINQINK